MSNQYHKPKLSIELTIEQQDGLRNINMPHGWQRRIFSIIVDELIELNSIYGPEALACIIGRQIAPTEAIQTLSQVKSRGEKLMEDQDGGA